MGEMDKSGRISSLRKKKLKMISENPNVFWMKIEDAPLADVTADLRKRPENKQDRKS